MPALKQQNPRSRTSRSGFRELRQFLRFIADGEDHMLGNNPRLLKKWAKEHPHLAEKFFAPLLEGRIYIRTYLRYLPGNIPGFHFLPLDVTLRGEDGTYTQGWLAAHDLMPAESTESISGDGLAAVHNMPTGRIDPNIVWSLRPCRGEVMPARRLPTGIVRLASLPAKERAKARRKVDAENNSDIGYAFYPHMFPAQVILHSRSRNPKAILSAYLIQSRYIPVYWGAAGEFMRNLLGWDYDEVRWGQAVARHLNGLLGPS